MQTINRNSSCSSFFSFSFLNSSLKDYQQTVSDLLDLSTSDTELPNGYRFEHTQGVILSTSTKTTLDDDGPHDKRVLLRIVNAGGGRFFDPSLSLLSVGSLKENGDYAILTMGVEKRSSSTSEKDDKTMVWKVSDVEFYQLPR